VYDILTEQAWSIKDLLHGFQGNFPCGTWQVVLSGQDSSILSAQVANHAKDLIHLARSRSKPYNKLIYVIGLKLLASLLLILNPAKADRRTSI